MVTRQDRDHTTAVFNVIVTREELKPKIDSELKSIRQKAPVKGFRPGHAPATYIKKMYGKAVFMEKMNDLFASKLEAHLQEHPVPMIGQPLPAEDQEKFTFNVDNLEAEYSLSYEVGLIPVFEVEGLDENHVYERYSITNADELAEKDLEDIRARAKSRLEIDEDIQLKDLVTIAAKELIAHDANILENGHEVEIKILVESVVNEDFKAELQSKKKGDVVRFNASTLENLNGKQYRKYLLQLAETDEKEVGDFFEGTITGVSRVQDAVYNEDFFKENFGEEVTNKAAALEILSMNIKRYYESRAGIFVWLDMKKRLLEINQLDLPDAFLKRLILLDNRDNKKVSQSDLETEYPVFADDLRWQFIHANLVERFEIRVSKEEIRDQMIAEMRQYVNYDLGEDFWNNMAERMMEKEEDVRRTHNNLETDRVFKAIMERVTIQDKLIHSTELQRLLETLDGKKAESADETTELGSTTTGLLAETAE